MAANVSGSSRSPVSSGLSSSTSCRYWTASSSSPTSASMASTMHPTEVEKAARENIRMSISGCSRRFCRRVKRTSRTTPSSSGTRDSASRSRRSAPSRLTPRTTPSTPPAAMSAPSTSHGPSAAPFDSGSSRRPSGRIRAISGMLMRKTEPHQKCWIRKPPRTGPLAAPMAATAVQMPMASARSRRSGKTCRRIERVAGMIIAPPTPSRARAAMRIWALSARAAIAEAAPKSA